MPLFGGHKHDNKHESNKLRHEENLEHDLGRTNAGTGPTSGMTGSAMPGSGVTTADHHAPVGGHGAHQGQPLGHHAQPGMANDYANTGAGAGYGAGAGTGAGLGGPTPQGVSDPAYANQSIAPTAGVHAGQGGGGHSTTGKIEKTVGSIVGSNALKAKGMQKEMEANALKTQSSELAEAERLEREALLRRERAVAHGAHPENRHLGGSENSA